MSRSRLNPPSGFSFQSWRRSREYRGTHHQPTMPEVLLGRNILGRREEWIGTCLRGTKVVVFLDDFEVERVSSETRGHQWHVRTNSDPLTRLKMLTTLGKVC